MGQKFTDAARSELSQAINSTNTALHIVGGGKLFPVANTGTDAVGPQKDWFKVVIQDENHFEIAYVRTHAEGSNSFTNVLRGMEGTQAQDFGIGAIIGLRPTATDAQHQYDHSVDQSNPHGVTKDQIGLGEVDNTSDLDKPVSEATQQALDGKLSTTSIDGKATFDWREIAPGYVLLGNVRITDDGAIGIGIDPNMATISLTDIGQAVNITPNSITVTRRTYKNEILEANLRTSGDVAQLILKGVDGKEVGLGSTGEVAGGALRYETAYPITDIRDLVHKSYVDGAVRSASDFVLNDDVVSAKQGWSSQKIKQALEDNAVSHPILDKLHVAIGVVLTTPRSVSGSFEFSIDGITWQQGTAPGDVPVYIKYTDGRSTFDNWSVNTAVKEILYWGQDITQLSRIGGPELIKVPAELPPRVTNLSRMFEGASSFNQDISSWRTGTVLNMDSMFKNATAFNQDLSGWDGTLATHVDFAVGAGFENEPEKHPMWAPPIEFIDNGPGRPVTYRATSSAEGNVFYQKDGQWFYVVKDSGSLLSTVGLFKDELDENAIKPITDRDGVTHAIPLNQVVTSFVKSLNLCFFNMPSFDQVIESWDTRNVTTMNSVFLRATVFNQGIGEWDTRNVTDMTGAFDGAAAFNQNIREWDTSNVTNMGAMFYRATSFNQDISNWCVTRINKKPDSFDYDAHPEFRNNPAKQPQWGTCPRGEDQ